MTKKHDAIFDDVLSGLNDPASDAKPDKERNRFLKRGTALGEKLSGSYEEKTLHWVDPSLCRMWEHHNRAYEFLTPENTGDLIDGIRSQGQQEFPAIVRKIDDPVYQYEVIAGARRHYAVSWLRANNYPQFKYLIEIRDLTDEEAFRLSDIENRDREDISDYERATDYAKAIELYYSGRQKTMAERIMVSEAWLSRYLYLAKLPSEIVEAYASKKEIKELHARQLKPLLAHPKTRENVVAEAKAIRAEQGSLRTNGQAPVSTSELLSRLKSVAKAPAKPKPKVKREKINIPHTSIQVDFQQSERGYKIDIPAQITRDQFVELAAEISMRFGEQ